MNASREASLNRAMLSTDCDTLHGGSSTPSGPPSPLQNHDEMGSGPCYCLKITMYETTHRGRWPLSSRLWTHGNIKHIMKDDLELMVIDILDHISSVGFTRLNFNGKGLTMEGAMACQEGFVRYMEWQGLTIEREIHPLTLQEDTAETNHDWQEIHGNYIHSKCESQDTSMMCCQSILRSSGSERSKENLPHEKNNFASTRWMYASPWKRHRWAHRRSPDGDPNPSDSDWDSVWSQRHRLSTVDREEREPMIPRWTGRFSSLRW